MNMDLSKMSSGYVLLISCILCMITMSSANFCTEDQKDTCTNIASGLNCVLCIIVIAHMFNMFKK